MKVLRNLFALITPQNERPDASTVSARLQVFGSASTLTRGNGDKEMDSDLLKGQPI